MSTFGLKTTVLGPNISPNLALRQSQSDSIDDAAIGYGDRLLMRIDPRDIRRDTLNATGKKRVHYMAPNRDPAIFTGSGISIATISGKYSSKEVFVLDRSGTAGAGTNNDFKTLPKSLNGATEFSVFGVAHYDGAMMGQSGFHTLLGMYRDRTALESCIAHQYVSSVNYLSIFVDQGDGGGVNHNLDTSTTLAAGTPFAYLWRVRAANNRTSLFVNNVLTPLIDGDTANVPESGNIEVYLGHLTSDSQQWGGAHGRAYIVAGDALDTDDNKAIAQALMLEMMTYYGIS